MRVFLAEELNGTSTTRDITFGSCCDVPALRQALKARMVRVSSSVDFSRVRSLALGSLLVLCSVAHSVCTELSARSDQDFSSQASSAVFLSELVKLVLAVPLLLRVQYTNSTRFHWHPRNAVSLALPAFLYTVVNVVSYLVIRDLGSTRYQLLCSIKVAATALTFRSLMHVRLRVIQWLSVLLLLLGVIVGSSQPSDEEYEPGGNISRGVVGMLLVSGSSAVAGVYLEVHLKRVESHPLFENFILYSLSCLFSLVNASLLGDLSFNSIFGARLSTYMWLALLTSSLYGQIVALILYYCDNMLKVFASSCAIFVSGALEHIFFEKEAQLHMYYGACIVTMATVMYYMDHSQLLTYDDEIRVFVAPNIKN